MTTGVSEVLREHALSLSVGVLGRAKACPISFFCINKNTYGLQVIEVSSNLTDDGRANCSAPRCSRRSPVNLVSTVGVNSFDTCFSGQPDFFL
jgi:hypothetical protein